MQKTIKFIGEFKKALLSINRLAVRHVLSEACKSKSTIECVEDIVAPAMEEIGDEWVSGKLALSQVYMGGRICEEIVLSMLPQGSIGSVQKKVSFLNRERYIFL